MKPFKNNRMIILQKIIQQFIIRARTDDVWHDIEEDPIGFFSLIVIDGAAVFIKFVAHILPFVLKAMQYDRIT